MSTPTNPWQIFKISQALVVRIDLVPRTDGFFVARVRLTLLRSCTFSSRSKNDTGQDIRFFCRGDDGRLFVALENLRCFLISDSCEISSEAFAETGLTRTRQSRLRISSSDIVDASGILLGYNLKLCEICLIFSDCLVDSISRSSSSGSCRD